MPEWIYNNLFLSYAIWATLCILLLFGLLAWRWIRGDQDDNETEKDASTRNTGLFDQKDDFTLY